MKLFVLRDWSHFSRTTQSQDDGDGDQNSNERLVLSLRAGTIEKWSPLAVMAAWAIAKDKEQVEGRGKGDNRFSILQAINKLGQTFGGMVYRDGKMLPPPGPVRILTLRVSTAFDSPTTLCQQHLGNEVKNSEVSNRDLLVSPCSLGLRKLPSVATLQT